MPSPLELHFILDIEATATSPDVAEPLQIGVLPVAFAADRCLWRPLYGTSGAVLHLDLKLPYPDAPRNAWHRENLGGLYAECNALYKLRERAGKNPRLCAATVQSQIKAFMRAVLEHVGQGWPARGVSLMGWNIGTYDLPVLVRAGHLFPGNREIGLPPDFDYRIYDLQGALRTACGVLGMDADSLIPAALEAGVRASDDLDELEAERGQHDAIYDCISNLYRLNGLLALLNGATGR